MEQHSRKEIQVKTERPPRSFQLLPDHIVEVQHEYDKDQTVRRRLDNKCDDPPDLSAKDRRRIQAQKLIVKSRIHQIQHESYRIQYNNIIHEV